MKKPDRFQRMVEAKLKKLNTTSSSRGFRCSGCMEYPEVVKLLRRQHAATVRIVKKLADGMAEPISDIQDGYHMACAEILDALERRRR